jgi:hypothetical protein
MKEMAHSFATGNAIFIFLYYYHITYSPHADKMTQTKAQNKFLVADFVGFMYFHRVGLCHLG